MFLILLGSPGLPNIYMSFEKTVDGDSTKTPYDRGEDKNGNSKVTMVNGANIGTSSGRPGKVLRMTGTNAGADAGYFQGHNLNNPGGGSVSISFWLRIASPQSSAQKVFGTGSTSWDTGLLFKVDNSAKVIRGRLIINVRHLYTGNVNVNDILTTWSHVVFTYSDQGPLLEIYINGRKVASDYSFSACTASKTRNPNLIFGGAGSSGSTYWGMHIDDFAVWNNRILTSNEIIYIMNKGYVQDPE